MNSADTTEDRLLAAIAASPDDDVARSVYADWLAERDDPRAEYVRLEAQRAHDARRLATLTAELDPAWLAKVARRYSLVITDIPRDRRIHVIKAIRQVTALGLREALSLVDAANDRPQVICDRVDYDVAVATAREFDETGATVHIEPHVGYTPPLFGRMVILGQDRGRLMVKVVADGQPASADWVVVSDKFSLDVIAGGGAQHAWIAIDADAARWLATITPEPEPASDDDDDA